MAEQRSEPGSLLSMEKDGFRIQWKNDGTDYPALWEAYRRGELQRTPLARGRPFREADLVEALGRRFLMKRDWHVEKRLEKRFWYRVWGATRYSRIIRLINNAVRQGCDVVQDVFLVAERMSGPICQEAYLIADYMEGSVLPAKEADLWLADLTRSIARIHEFGLACNDIQSYNFIRTTEGIIKGIDLDISSPLIICQVNDALEMKRRFNVDLPLKGPVRKVLYHLLLARNLIRARSRQLRGKSDRYIRRS